MSQKSILCITTSRNQADQIVDQLKRADFSSNDISVLFPNQGATRDFAHEKNTKAPEGAVAGASTGGFIGGALGWIAGIGALNGAAVGAVVGGIAGGLIGLGISESEARLYEGKVKAGNILISVKIGNAEQITAARDIFLNSGAQDICTTVEASLPGENKPVRQRAPRTVPALTATVMRAY